MKWNHTACVLLRPADFPRRYALKVLTHVRISFRFNAEESRVAELLFSIYLSTDAWAASASRLLRTILRTWLYKSLCVPLWGIYLIPRRDAGAYGNLMFDMSRNGHTRVPR